MYNITKPSTEAEANGNTLYSDIYFKQHNSIERLRCSKIRYLEAAGSYCNINLTDNKVMTVSQPLGEIISKLPANIFIRVHRSYIININYVNKFNGNNIYVDGHMIPIGRLYKKEALSHFNIVSKGVL